jgi:hypothetical protein
VAVGPRPLVRAPQSWRGVVTVLHLMDISYFRLKSRANTISVDVSAGEVDKASRILQKKVLKDNEMHYTVIRFWLCDQVDEKEMAEAVARFVKLLDEKRPKPRGFKPSKKKKDVIDEYLRTKDGKAFSKLMHT